VQDARAGSRGNPGTSTGRRDEGAVRRRRRHRRRGGRGADRPATRGELYELTGRRLLSFAEAVAEIADVTGRELRYVPVPLDAFASGLTAQGVPDDVVELITYLFDEVLDGRNAHLTDGVQRVLGREPRDFRDYARDAAATGVWDPVAERDAA
jgi:uncharacterized protein YbjT (DUF2867 family)